MSIRREDKTLAAERRMPRTPGAWSRGLAAAWILAWAVSAARAGVGDPLNTAAFKYQMKITFSGYTGASALTNFPALVVLNTGLAGFDYGQLLSGGADLRFADASGFELAYEIDTWNTSGDSCVWVRVPRLASATDYVRAFWGNAAAAAPSYVAATWSTWAAVWHLREAAAVDSSSPAYNGVANGSTGAGGLVGTAQNFGGSAWIDVRAVAPAVPAGAFTLSAAFRTSNTGGGDEGIALVSVSTSGKTTQRNWWRVGPASVGSGELNVVEGASAVVIDPNTPVNDNVWHTFDYVRNGATGTLYIDGTAAGSHTPGVTYASTDLWSIGQRYAAIFGGAPGRYFIGLIDEVRVAPAARSADWVKAADGTIRVNAAFTTYGAVESTPETGSAFFGW